MASYLTPNRHGYSVRFSPHDPQLLVVATSQFFGLTGGGTLFVLELPKNKEVNVCEIHNFQWKDGLFDVVWSETNPNHVLTCSGDGGLQLWDLSSTENNPKSTFWEHSKEVYSLDWSKKSNQILSASWDCSTKLWDANRPESLNTFQGHSQLVYSAKFSPFISNCFASVSGDGTLKLWDVFSGEKASSSFRVHDAEVLSCDWSKFDENIICTSGSDALIRAWDVRNYLQPLFQLKGHNYAVRRIQCSPHFPSVLASVSYDFSTRIWDFKNDTREIEVIKHHSEFVYGVDWNWGQKGQLADCGWDSLVHVFNPVSLGGYF